MLDTLPEMPVWPQLPRRTFLENMYVQYSEGLPGIVIDMEGERVFFDTTTERFMTELEECYTAILSEDSDHFAISAEHAAGLGAWLDGTFSAELAGRPYIKGQVTGPLSFGLTVTDQDGRAALYNEALEEAIVKGIALKAKWQVEALRTAIPGPKVVLFIDEPYLVSVGSALISVSREKVIGHISECLRTSGAEITGIHCCGNTDWSLVFETGVDMVNFDAFGFMDGFTAYDREITEHLDRGGLIAWGIVPNSDAALSMTAEELADRLEAGFETLGARGVDLGLLAQRSLITPACGLGPLNEEISGAALALVGSVSDLMRKRYGREG